ncbi:hypothetical protein [Sporosarcina ureae]|uniref:hypothetical protein n=1 Tax=Sporosarcina ureae TaxID=1571 RepID=UPI001F3C4D5B|nr:hypothetical protein [Sporosarcina ureae]
MKRMLKPTIISISMATVMAGAAISPALGLIAANFPENDQADFNCSFFIHHPIYICL